MVRYTQKDAEESVVYFAGVKLVKLVKLLAELT